MSAHQRILAACFSASPKVRYVAAYLDGQLELQSRADVQALGASESDRYEELIVNPALLTLVTQRGNIDCGGCRYVVVRYGRFYAFIYPLPNGHVTVSLELDSALDQELEAIAAVIDRTARRPAGQG